MPSGLSDYRRKATVQEISGEGERGMIGRPDRFDGCYNCDFQQRGYCPQEKVTIQHDKMVCGGGKWRLKQPKGEKHGRQAHST